MKEYQRWALSRLPVGDGLPVDLYEIHMNADHRFGKT